MVVEPPPVEDVVELLLLVVADVDEEIVLVVVVDGEVLVVAGEVLVVDGEVLVVDGEVLVVDGEVLVVVDGEALAPVLLRATKVVPGITYPEASTQLPGAMFSLPEYKHAWVIAHDQAWFVPGIKPQQICSVSRQTSPQAR